ncbi:MAG: DNA polymerase III subunit alpha [Thermodesulfovibrionales bacterium]
MHHSDYVPLHLHTEYSLLDGAIRIEELVEAASAFRMPAVAMTDHGNLFGAVEFYRKAAKAGVKPIIGCEVYVAPAGRMEKARTGAVDASYHLVLLARDNEGYRNLVNLVSKAYIEGFYYKPRIDGELLVENAGGLIGLSACLKGEVPFHLRRQEDEKARKAALFYREVLGPENFFIELQENGIEEQTRLNVRLLGLARELGIPVVATNDCHYLRREDARAHDILLCIQTGKTASDENRLRFGSDGFYFKSPEEMKEAFREVPEAVLNTREIAQRCNVEFRLGTARLPRYDTPDGSPPTDYLERLSREGLARLFRGEVPPAYSERLARELSVIKKMGYAPYFLIVWDFINYAKGHGVPVGPGRGSAAGSLVAYSLGITEIDPIRYGLLFERFLNPERVSMPDIDVDFCKDKRGEVLSYVAGRYGKDHVAQIITFGTMAARAAIRDVARVLDFPYAEADRLAKLVPEGPKVTLEEAIKCEAQLRDLYENDPKVRELLDIARRLEGLARHASTHAAGVVIAPEPLTHFTPLYRNPADESVTTQFDMGSVETMGLIKFDFLGLKTLTIIEKTIGHIRAGGAEFSLKDIPLDDEKTYALLGAGQTTGVFQLESAGMRDILVKMTPNRFEDLIALVALYRPGPIGSGMIDDFIKRKKGQVPVRYDLPQLRELLDETYGVMLYQEQVMSIAGTLANFSMGQADVLRKAMGKKKPEEMERQKEAFMKGAMANGISEKKALKIFNDMAKFAEYGFNKSHSAAYALIAYQTAYLKAHYPVEFMAATLSADLDNTDKIVKSINECRQMSIEILPPDINECGREFMVSGGRIRFGLGAVKGAGTSAIESILAAREAGRFASFEDFLERVDAKKVNKRVVESLIKAGAFDTLDPSPEAGSRAALGRWRARAMEMLGNGSAPSLSLFGQPEDPGAGGWDEAELLRHEKDALGFYITGNPLTKYKKSLAMLAVKGIADLDAVEDRQEVSVAGIVTALKRIRTKGKAETMSYLTLEDDEGIVEVIVFPDLHKASAEVLKKDAPLLVRGTLDRTEKGLKIIARELSGLDDLMSNGNGKKAEISINGPGHDLRALKAILSGSRGSMPLYLRIRLKEAETVIQTSYGIQPAVKLVEDVESFFGKGTFRIL